MGSDRALRTLSKGVGTLPCENDQAKPDRFSRLARSTYLSKILEGFPPERGPLGSRPGLAFGLSSNLLRTPTFSACIADSGVFARTFQTLSKSGFQVKETFDPNHGG